MIEELIIFLIILTVSIVVGNIALKEDHAGPFFVITSRLGLIGVCVHEFSHYIANLMVGIKPRGIKIKWRSKPSNRINPHGEVKSKPRSFLQAFLICLAPLYISTWLIFLTLQIVFNPSYFLLIRIIAGIFCVSLVIGASPSSVDFINIFKTFSSDIINSVYQVFLIIISIFILWAGSFFFEIVFILDVFYYFAIAAIYWVLKLSFRGINKVLFDMRTKNYGKPHKLKVKRFSRRRYKPQKSYKIGIEEAPW